MRSRAHVVVALLLGLGLPFAVLAAAALFTAHRTLEDEAVARNSVAARLGAEAVSAHVGGLAAYTESFGTSPELAAAFGSRDVPAVESILRRLVEGNDGIDRAFVTDAVGVELADWPGARSVIGQSFAHRDWFKGASSSGRTYVSEVYLRQAEPRLLLIAVAVPIRASDAGVAGYLVAHHPIEAFMQRLLALAPSPDGALAVVDARGHLLDPRLAVSTEPSTIDAHAVGIAALGDRSLVDPVTGEESLASVARADPPGWTVAALQPTNAVFAPARTMTALVAACAAVCLALAGWAGFAGAVEIRRHHAALAELDAAKEMLTAMIVHDLRNPLTAIMGWIDLAHESPQRVEDVSRALRHAREATDSVMQMVTTLVDVVRMEDGHMPIDRARVDVAHLARERAATFQGRAETGQVTLRAEVPGSPTFAAIDPTLVARVIDNLVTNALKHTPPGGMIELRTRTLPGDGVALVVRDTGEGIAEADLPRLFQKYGRASGQSRMTRHDTGLGLVFSRLVVEAHGGRIWAESQVGTGTEIHIEFPAGTASAARPQR